MEYKVDCAIELALKRGFDACKIAAKLLVNSCTLEDGSSVLLELFKPKFEELVDAQNLDRASIVLALLAEALDASQNASSLMLEDVALEMLPKVLPCRHVEEIVFRYFQSGDQEKVLKELLGREGDAKSFALMGKLLGACGKDIFDGNVLEGVLFACFRALDENIDEDIAQVSLDLVFPQICRRCPHRIDIDKVFALWAKHRSYPLAVGLFGGLFDENQDKELRKTFLRTFLKSEEFLAFVRDGMDIRVNQFWVLRTFPVMEKQSVYLLTKILDVLEIRDDRWDWFFNILDAMSLQEAHHAKALISRYEICMRKNALDEEREFKMDMSWVTLLYAKGFCHTNQAVVKVVVQQFFQSWVGYLEQTETYHEITPDFVFGVLLPGLKTRELFRCTVLNDLTNETGSLFGLEESLVRFLFQWMKGNDPNQFMASLRSIFDFVVSMEDAAQGHITYVCVLVRALTEVEYDGKLKWFGEKELARLLDFMFSLSYLTEEKVTRRRVNWVIAKVVTIIDKYGFPGMVSWRSVCKLIISGNLLVTQGFSQSIALLHTWVNKHEEIRGQVHGMIMNSLNENHEDEFNAKFVMVSWFFGLEDDKQREPFVGIFEDTMLELYSSPYVSMERKVRFCKVLLEIGRHDPHGLLLRRLCHGNGLRELLDFCAFHLEHDVIRGIGLTEAFLGSATIDEGDHNKSLINFILPTASVCCKYVLLENTKQDERHVVESFVRTWIEKALAMAEQAEKLDDLIQSLQVVRALVECIGHLDDMRVKVFHVLKNGDKPYASLESGGHYVRSALLRSCESLRWESFEILLTKGKMSILDPGKDSFDMLNTVLEGFDLCNEELLPVVFRSMRFVLSTIDLEKNELDGSALFQAGWSAHISANRINATEVFAFCECFFQERLFRDARLSQDLVRPLWNQLFSHTQVSGIGAYCLARHCVLGILIKNPDLIEDWIDEVLDLLTFKEEINTTDVSEFAYPDIYKAYRTAFEDIDGVPVHQMSFVWFSVLRLLDSLDVTKDTSLILKMIKVAHERGQTRGMRDKVQGSKKMLQKCRLWMLIAHAVAKFSESQQPLPHDLYEFLQTILVSHGERETFQLRVLMELTIVNLVLLSRGAWLNPFLTMANNIDNQRGKLLVSITRMCAILARQWQDDTFQGSRLQLGATALPGLMNSDVHVRKLSAWVLRMVDAQHYDKFLRIAVNDGTPFMREYFARMDRILLPFSSLKECTYQHLITKRCNIFGEFIFDDYATRIKDGLGIDFTDRATAPHEQVSQLIVHGAKELGLDDSVTDRQQKIDPWGFNLTTLNPKERGSGFAFRESYGKETKPTNMQDFMVITSLLKSTASVASLARTSEIFAAKQLVLRDLNVAKEDAFRRVAVAAANWMPLIPVAVNELEDYVLSLKEEGYEVIGIEQHYGKGKPLSGHKFTNKKVAFLMGDEVAGIPVPLLQLCDTIITIKSQGISPSILTHIAGGVVLYEFTKQTKLNI